MKKLFALASILALFTTSSLASDLSIKNFKLYGEASLIGYVFENWYENYGGTTGHTMIGTSFDVSKNVSAALALGFSYEWGESGLRGNRIVDGTGNETGYLNKLGIEEANLTFCDLFDIEGLKLKVGRQYYGDEGSPIMYIGIRRYQPDLTAFNGAITSLDAVTAYYEKDNIKANLVYGLMESYDITTPTYTKRINITLIGGDFKYLNLSEVFDIQTYFYTLKNYYWSMPNYTILGTKPTFKKDGFKASIEFAKNFGGTEIFSNEFANTNLIKIDASYNIESAKITPRASYFLAGGENTNPWDWSKNFYALSNYKPGLIYASWWGDSGYFDEKILNIGIDYAKVENLVLSFDYYNFGLRDGKIVKVDPESELDLIAKYAYSENIELFAGIGHYFGNSDRGYDASTVQAGLTYKF